MGTSRSHKSGGPFIGGAFCFSGRRDPTWSIEATTAQTLIELWNSLDPVSGGNPIPSRLGYRGCVLRSDDIEWTAYNGLTARMPKGSPEERECKKDPDRTFEKALMATAPADLLPPSLIETE
ncbi:MAG: hypothetical protein OEV49_17270 [candidate division Zixibacteria bacterium]|nr:hypothetical protein [candidate division Zixibacteria bacterium]MDH3937477.1 hypothetical protein [candidate division Zixibacteria bacterium]MDH4034825.1 hypothetical protein [candidate division Zixibacteria bacterium]